jgi:ribosomal protein S18 acetylase RimI-like enzyme
MSNPQWSFRAARDTDRDFLFALYATTMREVVVATWGWDEAWQRGDFDRRFDSYRVRVIDRQGLPIGAVFLEWLPNAIYLHEIQLLPPHQRAGMGSEVIRTLLAEAAGCGLSVSLSVVQANGKAQRLYARLGFKVTGTDGPFVRMEHSISA